MTTPDARVAARKRRVVLEAQRRKWDNRYTHALAMRDHALERVAWAASALARIDALVDAELAMMGEGRR